MSLSDHIDKIVQALPPQESGESQRGIIRRRLTGSPGVFLGQVTESITEDIPDFTLSPSISAKYYYSMMMQALQSIDRFVDDTAPEDEIQEIADVKRLLEWLSADRNLGDEISVDSADVGKRLGIAFDPHVVRHLWDAEWSGPQSDVTRRIIALTKETPLPAVDLALDAPAEHPRLSTWRERQMARCGWEIPVSRLSALVHPPLSIELSKGCSVGCWFCGVSALKLGGNWPYTDDNAVLWRSMLQSLAGVLGSIRGDGFLYWATDPLDNVDYEKFCTDHADIMGRCPQTTTALALKNVERTKGVLKLSRSRGCRVDRFSLLTLNQVRKVMDSFTARELLHVKLVFQNPQSVGQRSNTGRAREMAPKRGETVRDDAPTACVSGYLVNTVDREVQLVTPCRPTDENPVGYQVLFRGHYESSEEFANLVSSMAGRLVTSLPRTQIAAFPSCLEFNTLGAGFELSSPQIRSTFSNAQYEPMQELGRRVARGDQTCDAIARSLADRAKPAITLYVLQELYRQGLLAESFSPVDLN